MMGADKLNLLFKVIENIAEYKQCFNGKILRVAATGLLVRLNKQNTGC